MKKLLLLVFLLAAGASAAAYLKRNGSLELLLNAFENGHEVSEDD